MPDTRQSLFDRLQRAGCWAVGLYAFALFFALGALISLLNGDILRTIGALFIGALAAGGGIWLARRSGGTGSRR